MQHIRCLALQVPSLLRHIKKKRNSLLLQFLESLSFSRCSQQILIWRQIFHRNQFAVCIKLLAVHKNKVDSATNTIIQYNIILTALVLYTNTGCTNTTASKMMSLPRLC